MTTQRLYFLTLAFGVMGFVLYWALAGFMPALAYLLGALGSFGNLWLFNWLARSLTPADPESGESARKPWQAGAFVGRYIILFTLGYVIVKGLGVNPLPVVFGLFASTAAVLFSSAVEIVQSLFRTRRAD
ncbi:MAG: ATP synthase subunit I [Acidobacteriaceae bacterium]|nr:ATP synthase subunit I [Acidobacteriaceae bacterium]